MVVFVFGRNGRYKKSQNFFIIQLALADFVLGVTLPYQTYAMVYPKLLRYINLCVLKYTLPLFSMGTSILSLIVLSADRYLAIHRPLTYQDTLNMTQRFLTVSLIWGLAALACFVPSFIWNEGWSKGDVGECDLVLILKEEFCIYFMPLCFFGASFIILGLYIRILMTATRQARLIQAQEAGASNNKAKKELKAARTVAMVLGTFYFCWLPFICCLCLQVFLNLQHNTTVILIRGFVVFLAQFNSGMNPVIYAFRMAEFRQQVRKMLSLN